MVFILVLHFTCRIMIHYVYGAFIALLLPDTQSRFVGPFANIIYFLIFDFSYSFLERCILTGCNISSSSLLFLHSSYILGVGLSIHVSCFHLQMDAIIDHNYDVYIHIKSECLQLLHTHSLGPKSLEPFKEWAWSCFSGILFGIHNHYILQPVGLVSTAIIHTHTHTFLLTVDPC